MFACLAVLVGCSGASDTIEWRSLELRLPAGWEAFEQSETLLSVADAPLGEEGDRGQRAVAVQFTHEPRTSPDHWRRFVDEQEGTLEVDERITVGGLPATRLVYRAELNGVPTREMVILVPAREVVILAQPVPEQGETDGPQRFLDHRDEFDAIIDSIRFGAPVR